MPFSLKTFVGEMGPIGKRAAKPLAKLGVRTVRDLLFYAPSRYDDFSATVLLGEAGEEPVTVRVRVDMIRSRRSPKKKMLLTEAHVSDESGSAKVVWFRQPFIAKVLRQGDQVLLSGRVNSASWGLEMSNPVYEKAGASGPVHTGRLVPVYPLTGGLTAKQVRALLNMALPTSASLDETLPDDVLRTHRLMGLAEAVRALHFPESRDEASAADRRFRFESLLRFQVQGAMARRALEERRSPLIEVDEGALRRFVSDLPFTLTDDQRRVAWRVLQDMSSGQAMHRLIEGDVGSGKTVVAAMAMLACAENGRRSLLMAPTEVLAEQHHRTLSALLGKTGHSVALRTRTHRGDVSGALIVVGTHALLEEKGAAEDIGLVVVDEQHRFGVVQRRSLAARLAADGETPHFLSMTATPIPRTLALVLYGDVAFSRLKQLPPGRKPVRTVLVGPRDRSSMRETVASELAEGRGVFVVCPLIEASDALGVRSAEEEAARLREEFPGVEVGLLHGRMKADAKRAVMEAFSEGRVGILVSTTVVEVGVDVPRATVMVVEGAERFGLAQLHQLRGRVGRNDLPSACFLTMSEGAEASRSRLERFVRCKDCFEIAELDLELRGPGSLFGDAQSGFAELGRIDPSDTELIEAAKEAALSILEKDPRLDAHPSLKDAVAPERVHLE